MEYIARCVCEQTRYLDPRYVVLFSGKCCSSPPPPVIAPRTDDGGNSKPSELFRDSTGTAHASSSSDNLGAILLRGNSSPSSSSKISGRSRDSVRPRVNHLLHDEPLHWTRIAWQASPSTVYRGCPDRMPSAIYLGQGGNRCFLIYRRLLAGAINKLIISFIVVKI